MKFYQNKESKNIVAVELKSKKVCQRSAYPEDYFSALSQGVYNFYDYEDSGVTIANEKQITFSEKDTYIYLGEAGDKEGLLKIVMLGEIRDSEREVVENIRAKIKDYKSKVNGSTVEGDEQKYLGIIKGLEIALEVAAGCFKK